MVEGGQKEGEVGNTGKVINVGYYAAPDIDEGHEAGDAGAADAGAS